MKESKHHSSLFKVDFYLNRGKTNLPERFGIWTCFAYGESSTGITVTLSSVDCDWLVEVEPFEVWVVELAELLLFINADAIDDVLEAGWALVWLLFVESKFPLPVDSWPA